MFSNDPRSFTLDRITFYNPEVHQNDSDPCTGSLGINICHYAEQGVPIIAVSKDMVSKTMGDRPFVYGQKVRIKGSCIDKEAYILDRMNQRYYRAVDSFRLDKSENNGKCTGTLEVLDAPNFFEAHPEQAPYAPLQTKLALSW